MDATEANGIIKAASLWPEPKRLVKRHTPEYEVLWRYSAFSRPLIDSRPYAESWSILTEYTFPNPVDTSWVYEVPDAPHIEVTEELRAEWSLRSRAIRHERDKWVARQRQRTRVARGLTGLGFRGIIFDADLEREALEAYRARLQRMASGPLDELPELPPEPIPSRQANPFARAPRGNLIQGRWRRPGEPVQRGRSA